jgi:septation ring formation regulator EzrA
MVSRRNKAELKVRDTIALLNALDAADRLDLVSYVFSDREIIRLFRKGELKGLPEKAISIADNYDLQVRPKEKKIGKKRKHK